MADQMETFVVIDRWRAGMAPDGKAVGLRIVDRKGKIHCLAMSPRDAEKMSIRLALISAQAARDSGVAVDNA